jgi:phage shock protein C
MRRFESVFHGGLYRSRHGVILGVCKGIAEYFDFSVRWTRIIAVLLLILSGFWPVMALYFIAALIMKPEPVVAIQSNDEHDFYEGYIHSRKASIDRLKRRYESLERRLRRMEHTVTSKDFDWEDRLDDQHSSVS